MKNTPKQKSPIAPPQRIDTHRTDTLAVREVERQLSADWIVRHQQDRDYGIDLMVEVFDGNTPTGGLVLLQIKGTAAPFSPPVQLHSFPVKTLLYAQMFSAPFFLFHVSVPDEKIYYVWLQKYIGTRLESDTPDWRTQGTVTIDFPESNVLPKGLERIAKLARYSVHRDLGFTFLGHFEWLFQFMNEVDRGNEHAIESALEHLVQISRLTAFLEFYRDWTDELDLVGFKRILEKAKQYKIAELEDEDRTFVDEQMDQLLAVKRMFLARDELDVFIVENSTDGLPY